MKVIKKGRPQKGWAKQITCTGKGNGRGGCGAVLLIEESDLFHTYRSIMGREEEWYVTFKCSECGILTDVKGWPGNAQDLPHHNEWMAQRKPRPTSEPERKPICGDHHCGWPHTHCDECFRWDAEMRRG